MHSTLGIISSMKDCPPKPGSTVMIRIISAMAATSKIDSTARAMKIEMSVTEKEVVKKKRIHSGKRGGGK